MSGGIYNLVDDLTLSRRMYLRYLKKEVGPEIKAVWIPLWFMQLAKLGLKIVFGLKGQKAPLSDLFLKFYTTTYTYSTEAVKRDAGSYGFVDFQSSLERTMSWHRERRVPKRSMAKVKTRTDLTGDRKMKVGIVGCGNIAKTHLATLRQLPMIEDICVADPDGTALDALDSKYRVSEKYEDFRKMIEDEKPDAIHVCTPPEHHADVALYAIRKGCHVFVEKPMTLESSSAEEMVREASQRGVSLCPMQNHLFDDVWLRASEIIAQGELGKITFIESWYGIQFHLVTNVNPGEHWKFRLPGSVFQDYLPHATYVVTDIAGRGKVSHVEARYLGRTKNVPFDELKVVMVHKDALSLIHVSLSTTPRHQFVRIYGTSGTLMVDFLNQTLLKGRDIGPLPTTISLGVSALNQARALRRSCFRNVFGLVTGKYDLLTGINRQIRLFYSGILSKEPGPVSGEEGLEVMRIMDAVWERIPRNS